MPRTYRVFSLPNDTLTLDLDSDPMLRDVRRSLTAREVSNLLGRTVNRHETTMDDLTGY